MRWKAKAIDVEISEEASNTCCIDQTLYVDEALRILSK